MNTDKNGNILFTEENIPNMKKKINVNQTNVMSIEEALEDMIVKDLEAVIEEIKDRKKVNEIEDMIVEDLEDMIVEDTEDMIVEIDGCCYLEQNGNLFPLDQKPLDQDNYKEAKGKFNVITIEEYLDMVLILNDRESVPHKKNINEFFQKNLNSNGEIFNNEKMLKHLKEVIISLIRHKDKYTEREIISLINKDHTVFNIFPNIELVFFKTFFENLIENLSSLIITNLYYQEIAKYVYIIYNHGTTVSSFETYMFMNPYLEYKNKFNLNLMNEIVAQTNQDYYQYDHLTVNSFRLFSLGHLFSTKIETHEKIIVENFPCMIARLTLELTKNQNVSEDELKKIYYDIYHGYIIPSTPMFYNSLKKEKNLLSSCFLINVEDDIKSIGHLFANLINILKYNSGVGLMFNKIRAKGRPVMDFTTESNGIFNYLNSISFLSNQFKNNTRQRSSNININLGLDHPDVVEFLTLKVNNIRKDLNLNNIFQTVSVPDEFIYRFLTGQDWYFISPEQTLDGKHLYDVFGEEYSELYNKMILDDSIIKTSIKSNVMMSHIVNSLVKTGGPFLFFRDVINESSNQKNIGVIQGTNLCTEILEYTDDEEIACCNIMSINLKKLVKENQSSEKEFDFEKLREITAKIVYLLNNTIDSTLYSHQRCNISNLKRRPMGIGIQGLSNLFYELRISYLDGEKLYKDIIENIYYVAIQESVNLANKNIHNLDEFKKINLENPTPLVNGEFHFELFKKYQTEKKLKLANLNTSQDYSSYVDLLNCEPGYFSQEEWDHLKTQVQTSGVINTLFVALMPTSLSSVINNNVESFEPVTYNIQRRLMSQCDIIEYNQYLVDDLLSRKYYDPTNVLSSLISVNGDITKLDMPDKDKNELSKLYQTIYEINPKDYIKFHGKVNPFIDQGKSFNIYVPKNNPQMITVSILHNWFSGTKTTYYYRAQTEAEPLAFKDLANTNKLSQQLLKQNKSFITCSRENQDCLECSA